ncbi:AAA family ATPase [Solibacillus sp. CAU 1738]
MQQIVKVQNIKIQHLKNVMHGSIQVPVTFDELEKSTVVGLYGQNGSGKTSVVDAFGILKRLISGWVSEDKLPSAERRIIHIEQETLQMTFDFIVKNAVGEYFLQYEVHLKAGTKYLYPTIEKLSYRENIRGRRMKVLVAKEGGNLQIRTVPMKSMKDDERIQLLVTNQLAVKEGVSFIFHKELKALLQQLLSEEEWKLIENVATDFNRDLHIINNENIALIMTKYIMPFSVYLDKKRGFIPYNLETPAVLSSSLFETLSAVIVQTNKVLSMIIPGLEIEIHKIAEQMLDDGERGIRFEFLSKRGDRVLPLRTESEGILKIISVLSALIGVYNNPNACVVIDELDSGVFEYLLGELLTIIEESGKGQLFFTSHNLRLLEVLSNKNLWFTTTNEENRYIQLKGIKAVNNMRDVYIRAVQLGGQDEEIYKETKTFRIKKGFRKAGKVDD